MKKNIQLHLIQNQKFFAFFFISVFLGILIQLLNGKANIFIALNGYHPGWLDKFFINYTFIGDGLFSLALVFVYFFFIGNKKVGLALLYSFIISGITAQIIKNLVNSSRPKLFFEQGQYGYFIEHVTLANNSSFPSGHTATAFAIATTLILILKDRKWKLLIFLMAILVGYSRIYLAQHFLIDVLIGACIGNISGLLAVCLVRGNDNANPDITNFTKLTQNEPVYPESSMQPL